MYYNVVYVLKIIYVWFVFRVGIDDDLGVDKLMMVVFDKVEKSIGKIFVKDDVNGMFVWKKEFD